MDHFHKVNERRSDIIGLFVRLNSRQKGPEACPPMTVLDIRQLSSASTGPDVSWSPSEIGCKEPVRQPVKHNVLNFA
jgi:hypothetical protein